MSQLYYNKETDKAFRVESRWDDKTWCKEVSTTYGRAKMHGHAKVWPMPSDDLQRLIESKVIFVIRDPKNLSRDIACIKAGIAIPDGSRDKLSGRRVQTEHVFLVGSLIEKPEDYQAICCAMTGRVIGHKRGGVQTSIELAEEEEPIEEVKIVNQLNLF